MEIPLITVQEIWFVSLTTKNQPDFFLANSSQLNLVMKTSSRLLLKRNHAFPIQANFPVKSHDKVSEIHKLQITKFPWFTAVTILWGNSIYNEVTLMMNCYQQGKTNISVVYYSFKNAARSYSPLFLFFFFCFFPFFFFFFSFFPFPKTIDFRVDLFSHSAFDPFFLHFEHSDCSMSCFFFGFNFVAQILHRRLSVWPILTVHSKKNRLTVAGDLNCKFIPQSNRDKLSRQLFLFKVVYRVDKLSQQAL